MRRSVYRTSRAGRLCAAVTALTALSSSGCLTGPLSEGNAAQPHLERKVFNISCEDGRRYGAKTLKARNYRITSADRLGAGSLKQKAQDNFAAIELLKRLAGETRPAR